MCRKYLIKMLLLGVLMEFKYSWTLNLSPVPNLMLKKPKLHTYLKQTRSSYFGFTIVLREKSVFIGAPRAQSTLETQSRINETGEIYKCKLNFSIPIELEHSCQPFPIDAKGDKTSSELNTETKQYQWLGATMVGGSRHADPLFVCAPRFVGRDEFYEDIDYLHGVCYWTTNTARDKPYEKLTHKIRSLADSESQFVKCGAQDSKDCFYYILGQQGFSAHLAKNNKEFLMGAPGIYSWRGSVIHYNINSDKTQIPNTILNSFSYFGYAVSSGCLESKNSKKIHYVATSPHSIDETEENFDGEAIIFDYAPAGESLQRKGILYGDQYGEFFGYAILVDDVNDDQLDDIIVSAPFYNVDGKDVGAVYVFVNGGDFSFEKQLIISPFNTQGHFGKAMSKLGDINKDGFNDIAIAAPFADEHGAVAIYLGSTDGLQKQPSQLLGMELPISIKMFGHGLSDGFDIDGNGFNDLAIGAPDTELVYIYRAYPMVYIDASIHALKPRVAINETTVDVEFCWQMSTASKTLSKIKLNLKIEVDPILKRMLLDNNNSNFQLPVDANEIRECQIFSTKIKPIRLFEPMTQKLDVFLVHDAKKYFKQEFCEFCVVLEANSRTSVHSTVTFIHGCKNKVCNVDLKLTALKMPTNFTLGTSNILYISYLIENSGENAYETKLELNIPLPISKIPSNCWTNFDSNSKLSCSIGQARNFTGNSTIELGFDVKGAIEVNIINITAKATSAGYELNPKDNELNSTIKFQSFSAIEILGQPNNIFESVVNEQQNKNFNYSFKLQNNGPSALHNITLIIIMPVAYKSLRNNEIVFSNQSLSQASPVRNGVYYQTISFDKQQLVPRQLALIQNSILYEYERNEGQLLPENNTISLYSNSTNITDFSMARLPILLIKAGKKLTIDVSINIDAKAVRELLGKKYDYLKTFMNVVIEPSVEGHVFLNITKIINPLIFVNVGPAKTPLWIIIAAAVGGIIVLMLMSFGLRKFGFFKRQTKEEMEELINEKLEKQRMKAELENSDFEEEAATFQLK